MLVNSSFSHVQYIKYIFFCIFYSLECFCQVCGNYTEVRILCTNHTFCREEFSKKESESPEQLPVTCVFRQARHVSHSGETMLVRSSHPAKLGRSSSWSVLVVFLGPAALFLVVEHGEQHPQVQGRHDDEPHQNCDKRHTFFIALLSVGLSCTQTRSEHF